jgi:hypothetical protein
MPEYASCTAKEEPEKIDTTVEAKQKRAYTPSPYPDPSGYCGKAVNVTSRKTASHT